MKCTHRSTLILALVTVVALAAAAAILMPQRAAAAEPTGMWLGASSPTKTGGDISVSGGLKITTALPGASVAIYKREVGETTDILVAEVPLSLAFWGNTFHATVPDVTRTCVLTATWAGNADYLPASYWLVAPVRAKVTIAAPRVSAAMTRLVSRVTPAQPMDAPAFVAIDVPIMVFQRRIDGHWRRFFGAGVWGTDGENWYSAKYFHLRPGTYVVRARFVGSNYNAAAVSRAIRFTIE